MNNEHTTATLENENGRYVVSIQQTEVNMSDMIDFVVKPLLLAAGYSPNVIKEYLGE
jgi:hypothetical protein